MLTCIILPCGQENSDFCSLRQRQYLEPVPASKIQLYSFIGIAKPEALHSEPSALPGKNTFSCLIIHSHPIVLYLDNHPPLTGKDAYAQQSAPAHLLKPVVNGIFQNRLKGKLTDKMILQLRLTGNLIGKLSGITDLHDLQII